MLNRPPEATFAVLRRETGTQYSAAAATDRPISETLSLSKGTPRASTSSARPCASAAPKMGEAPVKYELTGASSHSCEPKFAGVA